MGALSVDADDGTYGYLTFTKSDGTSQSLSVNSLKLTVQGSTLKAVNADGSVAFNLSDLSMMAFTSTSLAVDEVTVEKGEEPLYVYSMNGALIGSFTSLPNARQKVGKGVYVVKTSDKTFKMIVS